MSSSPSTQQFKQRLDEHHQWPCTYMFKFIVPLQQTQKILDLFESRDELHTRPSRYGRYMSVTARCTVSSSDEVVAVYQAASQVQGVISL
ncbi:MAG: DUF493 domain-containing protein [Desulfovermiculus sp.]|nr:DUF493 domain-containing protein [Desulfovermiculus sp.]